MHIRTPTNADVDDDGVEKSGLSASPEELAKDAVVSSSEASTSEDHHIPMKMKLFAVLLVTAIGFGSHWSSGVTGAMKSTLKKACLNAA